MRVKVTGLPPKWGIFYMESYVRTETRFRAGLQFGGSWMKNTVAAVISAVMTATSVAAGAQQVLHAPSLAVGDMAPDFSISGATRYGLLKNPIKLSDFRGSTVVLAFFYQARTKG